RTLLLYVMKRRFSFNIWPHIHPPALRRIHISMYIYMFVYEAVRISIRKGREEKKSKGEEKGE
ncbi:hypothetical protein CSUI_009159, partial [Cystoisospora suis]